MQLRPSFNCRTPHSEEREEAYWVELGVRDGWNVFALRLAEGQRLHLKSSKVLARLIFYCHTA